MPDAIVIARGRLTADPSYGHTKTDDLWTNFDIAVNHGYFDQQRGQWVESGTTYLKVSAFRHLAVNVVQSLTKGMPVVVEGKLRLEKWDNGEKQGTTVRIKASSIGPDLNYGQAGFTSMRRADLTEDPMDDPNLREDLLGEAPDHPPEPGADSLGEPSKEDPGAPGTGEPDGPGQEEEDYAPLGVSA